MKKTILSIAMVAFLLAGLSLNAFAYNIADLVKLSKWTPAGGFDYGSGATGSLGSYIGTGDLSNYGDNTVLNFFRDSGYDEITQVGTTATSGPGGYAGTWRITSPTGSPTNFVDFIIVKGSTGFSLHQYIPGASSGLWDVGYLYPNDRSGAHPNMSFVRAYNDPVSVPESSAASTLVLGFGLIGFAGYYGNRTRFKRS